MIWVLLSMACTGGLSIANATAAPFTYIAVSTGEYDLTLAAGVAGTDCTDATCMIAEEDDAATGDLDITAPMCVVGRNYDDVIVRGGGDVGRAFDVHGVASSGTFPGVVLADLTIEDSYAPAARTPGRGARCLGTGQA